MMEVEATKDFSVSFDGRTKTHLKKGESFKTEKTDLVERLLERGKLKEPSKTKKVEKRKTKKLEPTENKSNE